MANIAFKKWSLLPKLFVWIKCFVHPFFGSTGEATSCQKIKKQVKTTLQWAIMKCVCVCVCVRVRVRVHVRVRVRVCGCMRVFTAEHTL